MSRKIGTNAEHIAKCYLSANSLQFITNNYYTKHGEIDLIMLDSVSSSSNLVFIEVRYRKNNNYGHPIETISKKKQGKLIKSAYRFISDHPQFSKLQYRFDAVTIIETNHCLHSLEQNKLLDYNIEWFKNIITL